MPISNHHRTTPLWLTALFAFALVLGLGGCADWVYRQDIQQGNVLDEEDLNQLELGMRKAQVAVLLGSPSVASPFHADRWDYVNTYATRGQAFVSRTLTLIFADDALVSIEGNYLDQDSETAKLLRSLQSPDRQMDDEDLMTP